MTTKTTSTAIIKKTSRLLPPSFGLAVSIVIVIAALYRLLLVALSTVASAYSGSTLRSIGDPNECTIGDPDQLVLRR